METRSQDSVNELDINDQLSLYIGRVARLHVDADIQLSGIHQTLSGPGLAVWLTSGVTSTKRLIDDCRLMLNKGGVTSPELTTAALNVLVEVESLNKERNRIVHDMWWPTTIEETPDQVPQWHMLRRTRGSLNPGASASPKNFEYLKNIHIKYRRVLVRLHVFDFALWNALPHLRSDGPTLGMSLEDSIAAMNDHFDLNDNGSYRIHKDSSQG